MRVPLYNRVRVPKLWYKGDIINYKVKYCGHFVQGKYQGKGILYYNFKEKKYYKGEFEDNKRHGYGKYYVNYKLKYEGEFKDDEYDGEGTIYYKDGSYYTGKFTQGKKNGEGKIYAQDNSIIEEGEFENGISPYNLLCFIISYYGYFSFIFFSD